MTSTTKALSSLSALSPSTRDENNRQEMKDGSENNENHDDDDIYDVVIVGGGVVGLSILRHAVCVAGWKCVLVEKERHLLLHASGSNSGIICTGVDAPAATLERALIRDSISQIRPFLQAMNIPHKSCGSLVCQWSWDDDAQDDEDANHVVVERDFDSDAGQETTTKHRLDKVLADSHKAGDLHATKLTPQQLLQREPNLIPCCASTSMGAVHIPGEIIVDPWLFSIAMAVQAREHGAVMVTNFAMDPKRTTWNHVNKTWTVVRKLNDRNYSNNSHCRSDSEHPIMHLRGRAVINATGLWSDQVQQQILSQQLQQQQPHQEENGQSDGGALSLPSPCHGTVLSSPHWTSRPRRGQYRVFASNPRTYVHHPIQPIPTRQTKGIFVFTSLYNQIVVGPTALDQQSKTNRQVNDEVAETLTRHAKRLLPSLDVKRDYIGDWVGIRPGTDQRDYQIQIVSFAMPWISVAGIRSTGLTASLGIGRHVTDLLSQVLPLCRPKALLVSASNNNASSTTTCAGKEPARMIAAVTPLPPLPELIDCFHRRGDGMVEINGHIYKVTHPITLFGWNCTSQRRYMSKL
jgi:glycerol-3-phosphate dehydrogenase